MKMSTSVKPAIWGAIGGAIATMIVGFAWGGWVTGGTAGQMASAGAESAIVLAFAPLCVAKAELQPEQIAGLKGEGYWKRSEFVVKAGWVANVSEQYRSAVAEACAVTVIEALEAPPPK